MNTFRMLCAIVLTQFLASLIVDHLNEEKLEELRRVLHARPWEKEGNFYQQHFDIKKWKDKLPEMGGTTPQMFRKKALDRRSAPYLYIFVLETVRAELCHELAIVFGLFYLATRGVPRSIPGVICLVYIIAINLPFIVIQRYNRPRIEKLLRHMVRSKDGVIIPKESLYT